MDIYFYCTYENSARGFFPSCLTENGLIPADGSMGVNLPADVWDFFSYDRFKVLWREYPLKSGALFPEPCGGILGIRRIEASFGGRRGIVNIVFRAGSDECGDLENVAAFVLGRYTEFCRMLSACMTVGGSFGYGIDVSRFLNYMTAGSERIDFKLLSSSAGGKMIAKILKRENGILNEKDLLRFAVTAESWQDLSRYFGEGRVWRKQPKYVITLTEFEKKFINS